MTGEGLSLPVARSLSATAVVHCYLCAQWKEMLDTSEGSLKKEMEFLFSV